MIEIGSRERVFAHPNPVDMRKGFNTLAGLVAMSGHDVAAGDKFLFVSKDLKRAKCIWLDHICARLLLSRIDGGRFAPLWRDDGKPVELTSSELRNPSTSLRHCAREFSEGPPQSLCRCLVC